jgi:glycosyltransferase involved in cell wall biosynthesis
VQQLHLVIPAHDEEHRIDRTLRDYREVALPFDLRIVVALDDCHDATAEIVARHAAEDPRVSAVAYPKLGKGGVLREAFRLPDADLIGFVDADGATPPLELAKLAEVASRSGVAIASRRHPASVTPAPRPLQRRVASFVFARAVHTLFRLSVRDTQCGAKVFRADVLKEVLPLLTSRDFLFDLDLLVTSEALGIEVVEVPSIWIDQRGSKVDAFRDARRMAIGTLVLWLQHRAQPSMKPVIVHAS